MTDPRRAVLLDWIRRDDRRAEEVLAEIDATDSDAGIVRVDATSDETRMAVAGALRSHLKIERFAAPTSCTCLRWEFPESWEGHQARAVLAVLAKEKTTP